MIKNAKKTLIADQASPAFEAKSCCAGFIDGGSV
jgi:hypothetical protein